MPDDQRLSPLLRLSQDLSRANEWIQQMLAQWRREDAADDDLSPELRKTAMSYVNDQRLSKAILAGQWEEAMRIAAEYQQARQEAETAERAKDVELQRWRSWAQFVFKDGGLVIGTDDELRAAVCHRHAAIHALEQLVSTWRQDAIDADAHTQCDLENCADSVARLLEPIRGNP